MGLFARIAGARARPHRCADCASPSALARAFLRLQKRGYQPISGGSENFAEFCPRVVQCVVAAGFVPGSPAKVPAALRGTATTIANNTALIQVTTPTTVQPGDLLVFQLLCSQDDITPTTGILALDSVHSSGASAFLKTYYLPVTVGNLSSFYAFQSSSGTCFRVGLSAWYSPQGGSLAIDAHNLNLQAGSATTVPVNSLTTIAPNDICVIVADAPGNTQSWGAFPGTSLYLNPGSAQMGASYYVATPAGATPAFTLTTGMLNSDQPGTGQIAISNS